MPQIIALSVILLGLLFSGCALHSGPIRPGYDRDSGGYPAKVKSRNVGHTETGEISYYAAKFDGRKTASGEIFQVDKFTAAHRTLPFGTKLKVTNLENGKSTIVVVNDRGPFASGRVLDVSPVAARKLGLITRGFAKASLTIEK